MKKIIYLVCALAVSGAGALTLKEQKKYKEWQAYLAGTDSYGDEVKKKCGYDIPTTMEDKFTTPFMEGNAHAATYCDSPRSVISGMCEDETSKGAIAKNVKKVECKLGKEKEIAYKLNGGTLTFTVGLNASNLDEKTKEWLENNLK